MKRLEGYLKELFTIVSKKEMRILPGHLAYFLVLSIMPLTTLISFIASAVNLSFVDITEFLLKFLPTEVSNLILPLFTSPNMSFNLVVMITGFFIVSNGMHSIIMVSNTLYGNEPKDMISRRIKALFLTVILINIFLFVLIVLGFGNMIVKFILSLEIFSNVSKNIYDIFVFAKYPLAFVLIFYFIKLIYTLSPDKKIPSKSVNKGTIFTSITWILVTSIYSYYANNLANYDLFYGSLSNLVVLLIWVYIISYTCVLGIGINVNEYRLNENKNWYNVNNNFVYIQKCRLQNILKY